MLPGPLSFLFLHENKAGFGFTNSEKASPLWIDDKGNEG